MKSTGSVIFFSGLFLFEHGRGKNHSKPRNHINDEEFDSIRTETGRVQTIAEHEHLLV